MVGTHPHPPCCWLHVAQTHEAPLTAGKRRWRKASRWLWVSAVIRAIDAFTKFLGSNLVEIIIVVVVIITIIIIMIIIIIIVVLLPEREALWKCSICIVQMWCKLLLSFNESSPVFHHALLKCIGKASYTIHNYTWKSWRLRVALNLLCYCCRVSATLEPDHGGNPEGIIPSSALCRTVWFVQVAVVNNTWLFSVIFTISSCCELHGERGYIYLQPWENSGKHTMSECRHLSPTSWPSRLFIAL